MRFKGLAVAALFSVSSHNTYDMVLDLDASTDSLPLPSSHYIVV